MLAVPEHTIFECYNSLLGLREGGTKVSFETKDLYEGKRLEDDVFSDYPCLLLQNKMIFKSNISMFLKKTTDIDEKFKNQVNTERDLTTINRLEVLC